MIEKAIQARLTGYTALTALLADGAQGVWAVIGARDAAKPHINWTIFNEQKTEVMSTSTSPTEVNVQISVFAADFNVVPPITDKLKDCLSRFAGTVESIVIQQVFYEGYNDRFDYDEGYYQRNHDFRIFYEE